jgi:hypothetical protein
LGDENANTLTGTRSDEIFVAGAGNGLFALAISLRLMALLLALPNTTYDLPAFAPLLGSAV